jgi:hypothetical protein
VQSAVLAARQIRAELIELMGEVRRQRAVLHSRRLAAAGGTTLFVGVRPDDQHGTARVADHSLRHAT